MFQFKQFTVDQTGCAMKINTDGVLLGAMATAANPQHILDIGTGTGVIALMLAQKFTEAYIDAVEIDELAAETANRNFNNSTFSQQFHNHPISIDDFFNEHPDKKFDLIVSNPPFYINSLESPEIKKTLAKHTAVSFFETLIKGIARHLSSEGICWLILPIATAEEVKSLSKQNGLFIQKTISIKSFRNSEQHREIICLALEDKPTETREFIIYQSKGVYSDEYKRLLQPYFIAF